MIIWLASYPKSGNTWMRLFLKTYLSPGMQKINLGESIDISRSFVKDKSFPSDEIIEKCNINFADFNEIAKNWETMQDYINLNNRTNYIKTHNALCTINGNKFTTEKNTSGAIYIVRDPRDVVISYSNYLGENIENTTDLMMESDRGEEGEYKNQKYVRSLLGTWSDNYNSWKNFRSVDFLIIKYEDMLSNPESTFMKVLKYLEKLGELNVDKKKLSFAISETSFLNLQEQERISGFNENQSNKPFFRQGLAGTWKKELKPEIQKKIENKFYKEMEELRYL